MADGFTDADRDVLATVAAKSLDHDRRLGELVIQVGVQNHRQDLAEAQLVRLATRDEVVQEHMQARARTVDLSLRRLALAATVVSPILTLAGVKAVEYLQGK